MSMNISGLGNIYNGIQQKLKASVFYLRNCIFGIEYTEFYV